MPIKLRVVGILYNNIVNLPGGGTVQQVLDAAVKSPGPLASGFGYIPISPSVRQERFPLMHSKQLTQILSRA